MKRSKPNVIAAEHYIPGTLTAVYGPDLGELREVALQAFGKKNIREAKHHRCRLAKNHARRQKLRQRWLADFDIAIATPAPAWSEAEQVPFGNGEMLSRFESVEEAANDLDRRYFDLWPDKRCYVRRALPGEHGALPDELLAIEVCEIVPGFRTRHPIQCFDMNEETKEATVQ